MRAIRPKRTGGHELLVIEELPNPTPAAHEALVRVANAGVNFIDVYHLSGLYPLPLPLPIGHEGAGTIEPLASGVTDLCVGERVAWAAVPGSFASHIVAPADKLVPVPDGIDTKVETADRDSVHFDKLVEALAAAASVAGPLNLRVTGRCGCLRDERQRPVLIDQRDDHDPFLSSVSSSPSPQRAFAFSRSTSSAAVSARAFSFLRSSRSNSLMRFASPFAFCVGTD